MVNLILRNEATGLAYSQVFGELRSIRSLEIIAKLATVLECEPAELLRVPNP
jgi:hypothetical protein